MKFKYQTDSNVDYKYHFLESVANNAPEVLRELEELLPLYEAVFMHLRWDQADTFFDKNIAPTEIAQCVLKQVESDFIQAFDSWIKRYALDKVWIKRTAFHTLFNWQFPEVPRTRFFSLLDDLSMEEICEPQEFKFDGWRFVREDSKDFERTTITAFKNFLRDYIKEMAQKAKLRGHKDNRRPNEFEQIDWLVHWTVKNWSMRKIQNKYDTSKSKYEGYENFENKANKAFERLEKKYNLPRRHKKHSGIKKPVINSR